MGWMTLHSVSLLYPDAPSPDDRKVLKSFMNDFANSLTCQYCERHFKTMFANYQTSHPEWANSRADLFLFVVRAHNTVNKRLDKPLKKSVADCLDALRIATTYTSFEEFRRRYIDYVVRTMAREMSGDTMIKVGHAQAMKRTNESYWSSRVAPDLATLTLPDANVLELINDTAQSQSFFFGRPSPVVVQGSYPSLSFRGGRLRLTR
jgi:hypothetical protein